MEEVELLVSKHPLAPVVIFGYNRPFHLFNLLTSLSENMFAKDTEVFIFLDGPRSDDDQKQVEEVREIAQGNFPFKSKTVTVRSTNLGLANSVKSGVSEIIGNFGKVIVLEDDLLVSQDFLKYMNYALNKYEVNQAVASIHGYQYPLRQLPDQPTFLRGADCWGWGTWKNRWDLVSFDSANLLLELQSGNLEAEFNLFGGMDYIQMLKNQRDGKIDSWAICWHASMFLQNKYTLFPPLSLVSNEGNDGSGVHSGVNNIFTTNLFQMSGWVFPDNAQEDLTFRREISDFYRKNFAKKKLFLRIWFRAVRELKLLIARLK